MKLKNRYNDNSYGDIFKEMFCELTYKLDELYKIDKDNRLYSHKRYYIVADDFCRENRCLAIRVPGKTVGCIRIDEDNKIVSIDVDFSTYEIREELTKFIGQQIEFE